MLPHLHHLALFRRVFFFFILVPSSGSAASCKLNSALEILVPRNKNHTLISKLCFQSWVQMVPPPPFLSAQLVEVDPTFFFFYLKVKTLTRSSYQKTRCILSPLKQQIKDWHVVLTDGATSHWFMTTDLKKKKKKISSLCQNIKASHTVLWSVKCDQLTSMFYLYKVTQMLETCWYESLQGRAGYILYILYEHN